jgi:WD40 repeat protein
VAVCANDGSVTIRKEDDLSTIIHEIQDSKEWCEVAEFSPDGKYLAIGSHDTNIYIYDTQNEFSRVGKCTKHTATITCIDWAMDSTYIRSVCNSYEILFFTIPDCS